MSKKLLKSTAIVSVMTFLSRISGLCRDIILAHVFGASANTDAFFVAFKIPNFLRRLFGEGAFAQAFVPVMSEYKSQQNHENCQAFVERMSGSFGALLALVTAVGVIAAPIIVYVFAAGFALKGENDKFELTVAMTRVTFPYIFFISLVAAASGILNTYGKFAVPAFAPVLLNLCLIGAALWLAPYFAEPVMALAWGVFVAGIAQLAMQLPSLRKIDLLVWPKIDFRFEGVRRVFRLMGPAIIGSSAAQVNLLVGTVLASFLVDGSISWLYYSDRLVEFPLGVFGIALATVILPKLSEQHAQKSAESFNQTLDWSLRLVLLIGAPATAGLLLLAAPMLVVMFFHGAFDVHDIAMSTQSLIAYSLGLPGFLLVKVLSPAFFARQDTKTPVRYGIYSIVANIVLSLILFKPFGHVGLAAATSIAASSNALMLYVRMRRDGIFLPRPGWAKFALRLVVVMIVLVGALVWLVPATQSWLAAEFWQRVLWLTVFVLGTAAGYVVALWLVGVRLLDFRSGLEGG